MARTHYEPRMTGEKECKDCKRILPVIAFAVCYTNPDGLRNSCRECRSDDAKRSYRKTHEIGKRKTEKIKFLYRCGLPERR